MTPFRRPSCSSSPSPAQALLAIKGISDTKVEKILEACRKLKPVGFVTGSEGASAASSHPRLLPPRTLTPLSTPLPLPSSRAAIVASKTRMRITTGSKELDRILGGGLETGR